MFLPHEEGQGLLEYALILILAVVVIIFIVMVLGPQVANLFNRVTNKVGGAGG